MSPSCAYGKKGRLYRYYTALPLQVGERASDIVGIKRVSAEALESYPVEQVRRLTGITRVSADDLAAYVRRVELGATRTEIVFGADALFQGPNAQFASSDVREDLGIPTGMG